MNQKKIRILTLQDGLSPDYMADMLLIDLINNPDIDLYSNNNPPYLFESCIDNNLYGRGFTLYKKLKDTQKSIVLNYDQILLKLTQKFFDLIIYPSIRRYSDYFDFVAINYNSNAIITVDGSDDRAISKFCFRSIHFKRELVFSSFIFANTISFFIPNIILKYIQDIMLSLEKN